MSGRRGQIFPDGHHCFGPFPWLWVGARAVSVLVTVLGMPTTARAYDKVSCIDSHESAQKSMKAGRLQESKEQLLVCADSSCPPLVREDCEKWLSNLDRRLQPVTIEARDATGKVLMAVRVPVEVQAETGTKPGTEERDRSSAPAPAATVEERSKPPLSDGSLAADETSMPQVPAAPPVGAQEGQVPLSPPEESNRVPAAQPRHSLPTAAWVTGVLALASFGTAAVLGLTGVSDARSLRETCAPNCPSSRVSAVRQELLIADLSALTGVAFSAATAWMIWTHREADAHEGPRRDGPKVSAWITGRSFRLDYAASF